MSCNAALRAVKLGYAQVFWYRGGIEALQAAGLQVTQRQRRERHKHGPRVATEVALSPGWSISASRSLCGFRM